jgi:hypothetical protein
MSQPMSSSVTAEPRSTSVPRRNCMTKRSRKRKATHTPRGMTSSFSR